jgi:hypothetical protein
MRRAVLALALVIVWSVHGIDPQAQVRAEYDFGANGLSQTLGPAGR